MEQTAGLIGVVRRRINIDFLAAGLLARLVTLSERHATSSYKGWLGANVLVHVLSTSLFPLIFAFSSAVHLLVFFVPAHYRTRRSNRCLSALSAPPVVRVHHPCDLIRPLAPVQTGCFSYSRWRWARTAVFAAAGKCCCCWAVPASESELLSKKLGWVGVFAAS